MRVLLVDVDSLRPDHLGCYGYDRPTSPTVDALAADGVRFTRAYASDTPCLPSRTALAAGRFGARTGVVTHFGEGQWYDHGASGHEADADAPLAFRHLSRHGVRTATVSSFGSHHAAYHFSGSFTDAIQPTPRKDTETAADVTREATAWLDRHAADDDWLLHVQYWGVHHPYHDVTDDVETLRDDDWTPDWPDGEALAAQRGTTGPRTADLWPTPDAVGEPDYEAQYADWPMPDRFETPEDVAHLVDGYDASVRRIDRHVDRLLTALDDAGVREEVTVVVTADHGEALGEHGLYAEHGLAHPPTQRVPLVVAGPAVDDPDRAVDAQVYQFDLTATLCDLFDAPVPDGWDAAPLTDALRGRSFDGRDALVCGHGIFTFSRAVYEDEWAYIRILHPGVFSHPALFNAPDAEGPAAGLELLHDREADPHMTENVVADHPDVADRLRRRLADWRDEMLATADAGGTDPLARMAVDSGPFYYVDPEELAAYYRETDRSDRQVRAVERARSFPTDR
ncbi:sulfatase [Haloarcula litorea]|uniref:sulfatase family protein n=1 Tax=Haloarcula litorea TaxID=3032579 RepID=UPI0023E8D9C7|nr:sulfatase [Halomicroarcula sp. GDY20]